MLLSCTGCEGFVPTNASVCPHCGAQSLDVKTSKLGGMVRNLATVATSGALAVTLMACYGGPPRDGFEQVPPDPDCTAGPLPNVDDPVGDDIDQNCDGVDGVASSSSSTGSGGSCVNCIDAVAVTGLVAPSDPFCSTDEQQAFDALKACVCSPNCDSVCGDNVCAGKPATSDCSACVQMQCDSQNMACSPS